MVDRSFRVVKDDLDNYHQRKDAAESFAHLAEQGYKGSLAVMLMDSLRAYGFRPEVDRRTKEGKEFSAAESALLEAAARFDRARLAAKGKGKS